MVYVRQETEDVYTPLHLVPPTVQDSSPLLRTSTKSMQVISDSYIGKTEMGSLPR